MSASNITPGHVRAFQAVRSQFYDNIVLWSCTINGEPGMQIDFPDEASGSGGGGEGGPERPVRQEFAFNGEAMTYPRPSG